MLQNISRELVLRWNSELLLSRSDDGNIAGVALFTSGNQKVLQFSMVD